MEELFRAKVSLLENYLQLSKQHAGIIESDDFGNLGQLLEKKSELIDELGSIDRRLAGYRRQDTLPLIGGIYDMERENIRLTKSKMHELSQKINDIGKRRTQIDRYMSK